MHGHAGEYEVNPRCAERKALLHEHRRLQPYACGFECTHQQHPEAAALTAERTRNLRGTVGVRQTSVPACSPFAYISTS